PERIRVRLYDQIPNPAAGPLRWLERFSPVCVSRAAGLSLGYGILLRRDEAHDPGLLTHEMVHTSQFEHRGSLMRFLFDYLTECLVHGYFAAPMEEEARKKAGSGLERG
ncbi:MAG: hypothetical protein AAF514_01280, partial [Verrucomicrobiota bacterium]